MPIFLGTIGIYWVVQFNNGFILDSKQCPGTHYRCVYTMVIQIQRLWIVWGGTQYALAVTILPVILLLSYIGLDIPIDVLVGAIPPDRIGVEKNATAMEAATYAILSSFTVLVTVLIAVRLLLARRRYMKIMPGMSEAASPYLSILQAMLVESYTLDSAWSLATAISVALNSPGHVMLHGNDSIIKIIAYFLVVYRVANGRGWTKQTEEKLTSLEWHHGTQSTTDEAGAV